DAAELEAPRFLKADLRDVLVPLRVGVHARLGGESLELQHLAHGSRKPRPQRCLRVCTGLHGPRADDPVQTLRPDQTFRTVQDPPRPGADDPALSWRDQPRIDSSSATAASYAAAIGAITPAASKARWRASRNSSIFEPPTTSSSCAAAFSP